MTDDARRRTIFRQAAMWAILVSALLTGLKVAYGNADRFGVWLPHVPLLVLGVALLRSPSVGPRPVVYPLRHAARCGALVAAAASGLLFAAIGKAHVGVVIMGLVLGVMAAALSLYEWHARRREYSERRLLVGAVVLVVGLTVTAALQLIYLEQMMRLGLSPQAFINALGVALRFLGEPEAYVVFLAPLGALAPAFLIARHRGLDLAEAWGAHACITQALLGLLTAGWTPTMGGGDWLALLSAPGLVIVPAFYLADRWDAQPISADARSPRTT